MKYGGSVILIHNSIQFKILPAHSHLDSTAIEIEARKKINISTVYIPTKTKFNTADLEELIEANHPNQTIAGVQ